jgi:hypothetical protein
VPDAPVLGTSLPPPVVLPTTANALVAEFASPPPAAANAAAVLAAIVLGRASDGTLLLRTDLGTLSLQTALSLPAGTQLDLRLLPGTPASAQLLNIAAPPAEEPQQPMQFDLGTTITATVRDPALPSEIPEPQAAAPLPGTQLLLRVVAPPPAGSDTILTGQVVSASPAETILSTPIGTLMVPRRLGLEPGTQIAFQPLEATPPPLEGDGLPPPAKAVGWQALDQVIAVLDNSAPALAERLRMVLAPTSPPQLTASLLFLMGALYGKGWPGDDIEQALSDAGHDRLRARLVDDASELRQLASDPATGDWRTMVLPLLVGTTVQPIRLYRRRGGKNRGDGSGEEGTRFIVEVEMSRLGPLQLDGLARDKRFDLVLRSHRALAPELRQAAAAIFHQSIAASGWSGEIAFTVAPRFTVAPMAAVTAHVAVSV